MTRIPPLIISASAGTGKTYRLAIEYVRLLLRYYGKEGFRPDNILVLTFTRKATSEIRERIEQDLRMLCIVSEAELDKRQELLISLRNSADALDLDATELNLLQSALRDISNDRRMLQVMTLDSYINSIFRNIVRPLRSLDEFDIDVLAIEKRMPYLLGHLMTPALKKKVDALLKRKVSSSLDRYRSFFASLIQNRWLHHLITDRLAQAEEGTLLRHFQNRDPKAAQQSLQNFLMALETLLEEIGFVQMNSGKALDTYFNAEFKKLIKPFPDDVLGLLQILTQRCKDPREAKRVLETFTKGNLYNGSYFRKPRVNMKAIQDEVRRHLANYLVLTLFLDEQDEILTVWDAILQEYDKLIYRYRNMTYDDIAWFSLEALSSFDATHMDGSIGGGLTDLYMFLSHRSRFILIDEFQDTSLLQFAILQPIIDEISSGWGMKEFGGLIVVGDEKQSIFGWRGGERDLILNLQTIFPTLGEVKTEVLGTSWRSTPTLVNFVNDVFSDPGLHSYLESKGMKWPYNPIASSRELEDRLSGLSFSCLSYQAGGGEQGLEQLMRSWVRSDIKPHSSLPLKESMAVLCRNGNQLNLMQQILDEFDISSIYQPNSIIPDHPRVKPLLAWMKWLAYREWTDFLEFLRSDYVMLKSLPLKSVLRAIKICEDANAAVEPDLSDVPVAQELYESSRAVPDSLYAVCSHILDRFLPGLSSTQRDLLNLQAFMNILRGFEASTANPEKNIPGFLQYLADNRKQDEMKQVAVEGEGSLQLLTIHKSKGLQFERVFVFYNLTDAHSGDRDVLNWFIRFQDKSFSHLGDYALSYHYAEFLKHSDFNGLHQLSQNRDLLEELNNLYVAFTRAKTKLHILFTYQNQEGWDSYLQNHKAKDSVKLPMLLCDACVRRFSIPEETTEREPIAPPAGSSVPDTDSTPASKDMQQKLPPTAVYPADLARVLPQTGIFEVPQASETRHEDLRKVWLEDRHNLFGNLAHHYLSYLMHATEPEHTRAARACIARFCAILPESTILASIEKLRGLIPTLDDIFAPRWDKVFTEFPIYQAGREMRVDRLMLDTKAKQALIVDFKTGGIHEQDQLERYKHALAEVPAIKQAGYDIQIRYVPVKLYE